jgi:hypothetical protein
MIRVNTIKIGPEVLEAFPQLGSAEHRFMLARSIMEGARAFLIKRAQQELHSTRGDFIAGVQPIQREGKEVVLAIVGVLPNMVENGWDGRFLHETLLGDEARGWQINADGYRYRAIPFRHKTPGTGPQGGQPMGSQYTASGKSMSMAAPHLIVEDAAALGRKVHRAAKKLISRKEEAQGQRGHARLAEGLAPKLRPHHVTDIYAGMSVNKQPVSKPGGGVNFQRTYTTFRTISEARPDAWYHPGIEARHFLDRVDTFIQTNADKAISAYLKGLLK